MPSLQRLEIPRNVVESIINAEMGLYLRGAGFLPPGQLVRVELPLSETLTLNVVPDKEYAEERLVLYIL